MSMKQSSALLILLLALAVGKAQNEGNIWYFGTQLGLDFSGGAPVPLADGAIIAFQGCAVANDAAGNLLFYTNGGGRPAQAPTRGTIWNRNHQVMYDMQGIEGGGYTAAQSALIIPHPGQPNRYFLFTMEEVDFNIGGMVPGQPLGRGLSYFVIDMNLNGGLGGVSLADQRLHVPSYESLTAVRHSDGQSYWIIVTDGDSGAFVVVPVTAAGILPALAPQPNGLGLALDGPIRASPDGNYLLIDEYLFSFNPANGQVGPPLLLPNSNSYSASFSPNSRYLFTAKNTLTTASFSRFDLQAPDIAASAWEFAFFGDMRARGMQIGPDGTIYFLELPLPAQGVINLSAIECPNTDLPEIRRGVFAYTVQGPGFGMLPNFPEHIFGGEAVLQVDLGPDQNLQCNGDTIRLDAQNPSASYLWSTGDTTQFLLIANPGSYSVTVSTNCGTAADTILIGTGDNIPPEVSITGPRSFCPGGSILLRAQANEFVDFQWATGETGAELSVSAPGLYQVTATDQCGASTVATAEIELLAPPQVQLFSPEALCPDESGTLEAISPNADNYQWSDGSILATAAATGPGEYNLRVSNACGVFDTAWAISARPLPEVAIRGDSTICPGEIKTLEAFAQETDELVWSNGQRGAEVTVTRPGSYAVEARNGCGAATATILLQALGCPNCFYVPSAFSPNDDGRNDTFLPGMGCMAEGYRLQVFSRWGSLLFESDDPARGWDGRFQGKPMPAGLYTWSLSYQLGREQFREAGEVLLLR